MAITDLLDRIPNPPSRSATPPRPVEPPRSFNVEVPAVGDGGIVLPPAPPDQVAPEPAPEASPVPRLPLPSYAVAIIGGLLLLVLALTAALTSTLGADRAPSMATDATSVDSEPVVAAEPSPETSAVAFTADPAPIPVDLLTRLEEASNEPLDVELSRLLDAIQHGFGRRSVQLEPTLRSYVYRMASRFEWNPDSFRVAVTAPDADLASARAATLERLFGDAIASGRLNVGHGVGPHSLSLVSE